MLYRLKVYSAIQNLDGLIENGADKGELLFILYELLAYDPEKNQPQKVTSKEAKAWAKRISATAHLDKQITKRASYAQLDSPFRTTLPLPESFLKFAPNKGVAHFDGNHLRTLPELLCEYARRIECLPRCFEEKWKPFRTSLLSQLIWYVKRRTKKYHDTDVSALASAMLDHDRLTPQAIKQFRKRNAKSIRTLGPLQVIPILPRRPR